jgi:hypothetical protein
VIGPARTLFAAFRDPAPRLVGPISCTGECAMCDGGLGEEHSHLVAEHTLAPMCVCHACYHVFLATNGRSHHTDDARYLYFPRFCAQCTDHELDPPVGLTFLFRTSVEDRMATWSPAPDGAVETSLPVPTWSRLRAANPELDMLRPLRDALLLRRTSAGPVDDEGVLLPSQPCFEVIAAATSQGRPTLHQLEQTTAAMEELWAGARARASSVRQNGELRHG